MRRGSWSASAPALFLMAWGGNHFTPLLHVYETDGGYAPWQANLLLGMYVGGLIPGLLLAAALSDRLGRRPVMVAGLVASVGASVVLALSTPVFSLLCAGRVLAGVAVGVAMSVGSSWVKELSGDADPRLGARRSSLTLTLGFTLGAGVTGVLAQWAPWPAQLPFVVHAVLCIPALLLLARVPETVAARTSGSLRDDLRVPSAAHRDFAWIVTPAAPWVFAAAGVAYAILPSVVEAQLGGSATIFATVLTVATLGTAAAVQPLVPAIDRATRGHALTAGLVGMSLGMGLAALAAATESVALVAVVAIVLGASYGVCIVAGLIIVQGLATPRDLAGITGRYYSISYLGFLLPTVLAALAPVLDYPVTLGIVAAVCVLCLALVAVALRFRTS